MKLLRKIGPLAAVVLVLCASHMSQNRTPKLRVLVNGPDGRQARLTRAEVYLDIWGAGQLIPMVREAGGATLSIDRPGLCAAWSGGPCPPAFDEPARLILQADGFAPVSRPLEFAKDGDSFEMRVSFRRPVARSIKVVDEKGTGVAGVIVTAELVYAETNHCGVVEGQELARNTTDRNGSVTIPDVDGDVALILGDGLRSFTIPDHHILDDRVLVGPATPRSTVVVHLFERQPLFMEFLQDGKPLVGYTVYVHEVYSGCGVNHGGLGKTDSRGQVRVDDFYPEKVETLELLDAADKPIWEGVPPFNAPGRIKTITLP